MVAAERLGELGGLAVAHPAGHLPDRERALPQEGQVGPPWSQGNMLTIGHRLVGDRSGGPSGSQALLSSLVTSTGNNSFTPDVAGSYQVKVTATPLTGLL